MLYHVTGLSVVFFSLALVARMNGVSFKGINNIPVEEMKRKYGKASDKYFNYKGIQVRYRDEGTGPVLLLLHGVCSFLETWDGWVPYLKDHYRVVRVDMPGFGMTGPALDSRLYDLAPCLQFMHAFITHMDIESCAMAGNSLGAYITWNYAVEHPEKVNKIILIDPIGYNQKMPWLLTLSSSPLVSPFTRKFVPRFVFDIAVNQVYGDKSKVTPEVKQIYYDYAMRDGNKGAYVDIFTMMKIKNNSEDLSKGITDIKAPTLIMWGTKDEWIPYEGMSKWKKDLPSAKYITYEGIGHVAMEEIPEITVKDAIAFLQ